MECSREMNCIRIDTQSRTNSRSSRVGQTDMRAMMRYTIQEIHKMQVLKDGAMMTYSNYDNVSHKE
jgi:hypothetical protein